MIKLLNETERQALKEIYAQEFNSELPSADQANIVAVIDNGQLQGFLTSEVLIRVGLLCVHPQLRKTPKSAKICKDLVRYTLEHIPQGASVITIASDTRFEKTFRKFGMREEQGKVFRIDL